MGVFTRKCLLILVFQLMPRLERAGNILKGIAAPWINKWIHLFGSFIRNNVGVWTVTKPSMFWPALSLCTLKARPRPICLQSSIMMTAKPFPVVSNQHCRHSDVHGVGVSTTHLLFGKKIKLKCAWIRQNYHALWAKQICVFTLIQLA